MNTNDRAMLGLYGYIDRRPQAGLPAEDRLSPIYTAGHEPHRPDLTGGTPDTFEALAQAQRACGRTPCPEHGWLCAYHGDEPDRCSWCHVTWASITASNHGCERAATWHNSKRSDNAGYKANRITEAALNRLRAQEKPQERGQSTFCTHLGKGATLNSQTAAQPHRALAGAR